MVLTTTDPPKGESRHIILYAELISFMTLCTKLHWQTFHDIMRLQKHGLPRPVMSFGHALTAACMWRYAVMHAFEHVSRVRQNVVPRRVDLHAPVKERGFSIFFKQSY